MSMATIIKKIISAGVLLCLITAAWPSRADICFLPTGECEQGAKDRKSKPKTCQEYMTEGGYYTSMQENMNCSLMNIPGCMLFNCVDKTCEERGFKLEAGGNNASAWPEGYSDSDWVCDSCKQGGTTKWKCSPRPCDGGYKTPAECTDTETWIAADGFVHKSGHESCGMCKNSDEISCPEGTTEGMLSGCYMCDRVLTIGDGLKECYKCRDMVGYVQESDYSYRYDNACYDKRSRQASDGTICYRPIEVPCGTDKYKQEEEIDGRYSCSCVNNKYVFSADNELLQYTAAGGSDTINIVSQRIGEGIEEWDYQLTSSSGFCSVSEATNKLMVDCSRNPSEESRQHTIKLEQTEEDGNKNYLTINIVIAADECELGDFEHVCKARGCDYEANGTKSYAGQTCYNCGECRSGVRAAVRSAITDSFNFIINMFD